MGVLFLGSLLGIFIAYKRKQLAKGERINDEDNGSRPETPDQVKKKDNMLEAGFGLHKGKISP